MRLEGNTGVTAFTFTVTRSGDVTNPASVDFVVSSAVANTADFGGAVASGTIAFAANRTSETLTVEVAGDSESEQDEPFFVTISNPSLGTIAIASAQGVILNDDGVLLTPTYEIQGSGSVSPLVGQSVTTQGIVTGDFQNGDADERRNLRGFYLQAEVGDGNPLTSDGLFAFDPTLMTDVNPGDKVQVTGTVSEFFGETQLVVDTVEIIGSGNFDPVTVAFHRGCFDQQ